MHKSTYLIVLILTPFLWCNSQETIVSLEEQHNIPLSTPEEDIIYFKDTSHTLDKYVGTWTYKDKSKFLEITITKAIHRAKGIPGIYNDNDFEDELRVKIIYKINGVEIFNSPREIYGNTIISTNKVRLIYNEPALTKCEKKIHANLTLSYTNIKNEKLIWSRVNSKMLDCRTYPCPDGSLKRTSNFIIPKDLILLKQ